MKKIEFEQLKKRRPCFLLGANSGTGFYNCFGEIYRPDRGERLYIIKGGPGTGKSTLMKHMAVYMESLDQPCELYFCSSDPSSLDGVRFPSAGIAFVDGTAPHVMEPKYLGVSERYIDLSQYLDYDQIERQKQEILPLYQQNSTLHRRASRYLAAASGLLNDNFTIDCEYTDFDKVESAANKLCESFLPKLGKLGSETRRFLSGSTADGTVLYEASLGIFADTIIGIEDDLGATSSVMMSVIRKKAIDAGCDIITCPCSISPQQKIDHIIIPEAKIAFCTINSFLPITVDTKRRIHGRRFRDMDQLVERKQRLRFNKRAAEELIDGACHHIHEARSVHDLLESYYIRAMDFDGMNQLIKQLEIECCDRLV